MNRVVVVGSANMDVVLRLRHVLAPGETQLAQGTHVNPGGKGANQAVAAARLGARVEMIAALGRDREGDQLKANLATNGVGVGGCVHTDGETGKAYILSSSDGENAIVVVQGANAELRAEHLGLLAELGPQDVVVCQLEVPIATVRAAFELARAKGARTVLNAAPAAEIDGLIGLTDVLVVNETEAAQVGAAFGGSATDPMAMTDFLAGLGPEYVVTTLGGQGLVARTPEQQIRIPAIRVEVRDTTGAGDTFVGALAGQLAAGRAFEDALHVANHAGALACTRLGAQEGMPNMAELVEFRTSSSVNPVVEALLPKP